MEYILKLSENKYIHCLILFLLAWCLCRFIRGRLLKSLNRAAQRRASDSGRYETLFGVLSKVLSATVYFFAALYALQLVFNISPASLIAATGIVGVAVGFGAQSLVKDSINGMFILLENQFSVGDLVTVAGFTGTVTDITLRVTSVTNYAGDRLFIPNGSIDKVINHSRCERCVFVDVSINYGEDIDSAKQSVMTALNGLDSVREARMLGIARLADSAMVLRAALFCEAGTQFDAERAALEAVCRQFEKDNIPIPYPHVTVTDYVNQK